MFVVLASLAIAVLAVAALIPFLCQEEAQASTPAVGMIRRPDPILDIRAEMEAFDRRMDAAMEESRRRSEALAEELAKQPPQPQRRRKLFRWAWESPAETRASLWHVSEGETEDAVVTGLLRICTTEAEGLGDDCIGIWQVLQHIRIRSCNRGMYHRITECDEETGETMLSVMRRAQRFALGVVPARSLRSRWISEMEVTCNPPESFPGRMEEWDRNHRRYCERTVELARRLVGGANESITTASVIAWGGRCENEEGACDDRMACSRGLARVPGLTTANAFWCRPGSGSGCPETVDPICGQYAVQVPEAVLVEEASVGLADI